MSVQHNLICQNHVHLVIDYLIKWEESFYEPGVDLIHLQNEGV